MNRINPKRLKEARAGKGRGKGWSRRQLSDRAKISARQIARIEASETDVAVRENTADRLARALQVSVQALSGDEPLDPGQQDKLPGGGQRFSPPEVQIGCKIDPHVLLAYDLVKRRYGPTYTDVIYLAPLLFVLLAEGSLAWRRRGLEKFEEIEKTIEETCSDSHLFFAQMAVNTDRVMNAAYAEQESIEKADLRGTMIRDRDDSNELWLPPYETNPFMDYLAILSKDDLKLDDLEINHVSVVDNWLVREDDPNTWKADYSLCGKELKEIAGNSWKAKGALRQGDVRLSDIPEELMTEERKDERVKWLESKYKRNKRTGFQWQGTAKKEFRLEAINAVLKQDNNSDCAEKLSAEDLLLKWAHDDRVVKEYRRLMKERDLALSLEEVVNLYSDGESNAKNQ